MNGPNNTKWILPETDQTTLTALAEAAGVSVLTAQILYQRGYQSPGAIQAFLAKDASQLHDPFLLPQVQAAVERILQARETGEKVVIYGDYDCDGVTSTFTLLTTLRSLGIATDYYIPNRLDEGYGLNAEAIVELAKKYSLLVTVDCGITACTEVELANQLGLDVIVTDHHTPKPELPAAHAVLNPKIPGGTYPFSELAGVGVAYKLAQALWKVGGIPGSSFPVPLSIVMLGTVADLVPLVDENRTLVALGLADLPRSANLGLQALIEQTRYNPAEITAGQVGFNLAPRINAAGRLGQADLALELLLTTDPGKAQSLAQQLTELNNHRQNIEAEILQQALEAVELTWHPEDKAIVVAGVGWHSGVVGIVASRLVEIYYRPVVVISLDGTEGHGSARSIPGLNIYTALTQCADCLQGFGGHSGAAGLTIVADKVDEFRERLCQVVDSMLTPEDLVPQVQIAATAEVSDLTEDFITELHNLEPFGIGNSKPVVAILGAEVEATRKVGREQEHLKLVVAQGPHTLDTIGFGLGAWNDILERYCGLVDIAGYPEINEWNGNRSIQMQTKDIRLPVDELTPIDQLFLNEVAVATDPYATIADAEEFYTKAVGVSFDGRQEIVAELEPGEKVTLTREPANLHDNNAIAIETQQGQQIGYLKREIAKHLAPLLDTEVNYQATVSQVTGGGTDQSFGVNLFLQKEPSPEDYLQWLEARNYRAELQQLSTENLIEAIRQKVIDGNSYHPKQKEALQTLVNGNNTLLIMGTGRGKSAVFQSMAAYLALAEKKSTLIIYPLRALVNDQYRSMQTKLGALGIRVYKATGSLNTREREELAMALHLGEAEVILATPEFVQCHLVQYPRLVENLGLFVVDESHHIGRVNSQRSAYRSLAQLRQALNCPLTLGVTATADDEVAAEISNALSINKVIIDPHIRTNLTVVDRRGLDEKAKFDYLVELIQGREKAIIYVNSREGATTLAQDLRKALRPFKDRIAFYHGGLANSQRVLVEELFREGELVAVVATSAFGEGVDIPDIRHVLHYHLTFNSTDFNQQSGRAGRDNQHSSVHLIYNKQDADINRFILKSKSPDREVLAALYRVLQGAAGPQGEINETNAELAELTTAYLNSATIERFRPSAETISAALGVFYELGLISREKAGKARVIYLNPPPKGKLDLTDSVRYNEGIIEREVFENFQNWAFTASEDEILALLNRPIYPTILASE